MEAALALTAACTASAVVIRMAMSFKRDRRVSELERELSVVREQYRQRSEKYNDLYFDNTKLLHEYEMMTRKWQKCRSENFGLELDNILLRQKLEKTSETLQQKKAQLEEYLSKVPLP